MTNKESIEFLRKEADLNLATKSVFEVFCIRKRPRTTLTLVGLEHKMQKEGYKYTKKDYEPCLRALAFVGFGIMDFDAKGRLLGIKNIKTTFKSLGEAILGVRDDIKTFRQRNHFVSVSKPPGLTTKASLIEVSIEIMINGHLVHVPIPRALDSAGVAALIDRLKGA